MAGLWGASISQAMPGMGGSSHLSRVRFPRSTIARCQPGLYSAVTTRWAMVTNGAGALGAAAAGPIAWVMPRATISSRPPSPASATALHHRFT
jgi:hypothetical protein